MQQDIYHLRTVSTGGEQKFFVSFTDGNGFTQEAEISREAYLALDKCRLAEKRQENEIERHRERFELSEAQLAVRTLRPPIPMEEAITQAVDMQSALATLTDTQRRRFLLYHDYELSYEQIAAIEGCKLQVVARSIEAAKGKLKNFFDEGGEKRGSK